MACANEIVAAAAFHEGFVLVGFARLRRLREREGFFARWLEEGRAADMAYLARAPERRLDPRILNSSFKSVVSIAYPYFPPPLPRFDWRAELRGRIAAYALGPDYHDELKRRARAVARVIESLKPGTLARVYVDTGPVFEREWAAEARLGWFGKNTALLTHEHGSYFFLAEIFTDFEFEPSREPYREYCGGCTRCLDLCPTGALEEGYLMEPRKCISYWTIENRGSIPPEVRPRLGNWIFGCDICQDVCPWNTHPPRDDESYELAPFIPDLMTMDDAAFSRRYGKSAVKRAKRRGLLRNAAVALGNSANRDAVPILARVLASEPEPMVRSHAAWALGALGGVNAKSALEQRRIGEADHGVRAEIAAALAAV